MSLTEIQINITDTKSFWSCKAVDRRIPSHDCSGRTAWELEEFI